MFSSSSSFLGSVGVLALFIVVASGADDGTRPESANQSAPSDHKGLWPVVQVDKETNKSTVDVHVPIFFDMTNSQGKNTSKLDLSVLSGLVTVNHDKTRRPDGQQVGPVTVTVFGIPVYSGIGSSKPTTRRGRLENGTVRADQLPINQVRRDMPLVVEIYEQVQKLNQRAVSGLSDIFTRLSHTLGQRAQPIENVNGAPTDHSFVRPSTFTKRDFMPKNQTDVAGSAFSLM